MNLCNEAGTRWTFSTAGYGLYWISVILLTRIHSLSDWLSTAAKHIKGSVHVLVERAELFIGSQFGYIAVKLLRLILFDSQLCSFVRTRTVSEHCFMGKHKYYWMFIQIWSPHITCQWPVPVLFPVLWCAAGLLWLLRLVWRLLPVPYTHIQHNTHPSSASPVTGPQRWGGGLWQK